LSEDFAHPALNVGGMFRWMLAPDLKLQAQYLAGGPYYDANAGAVSSDEHRIFQLRAGHTHELSIEWDCQTNVANLEVDVLYTTTLVGLAAARGMNYLRLVSTATNADSGGLWILNMQSESAG
jgi:hypothetical protein